MEYTPAAIRVGCLTSWWARDIKVDGRGAPIRAATGCPLGRERMPAAASMKSSRFRASGKERRVTDDRRRSSVPPSVLRRLVRLQEHQRGAALGERARLPVEQVRLP